jgi:hypothetical protein
MAGFAQQRSTAVRVPEPRSRTSRLAAITSLSVIFFFFISGCAGLATNAIGCRANLAALVRNSRGGVPMMASSISCRASILTISARLPTCSFRRTSGRSIVNGTSNGGSKCSAVVTAPMRNVPLVTPCSAASSSPACSHRPQDALGEFHHHLARRRQLDVAPDLARQRDAGDLLQCADLQRHRGLRDVHRVGRARHALVARHQHQRLQLAKTGVIHKHSLSIIEYL